MALNIKSPANNLGKGTDSPSRGGEFNGINGYQKRTPTPNGPKERVIEADYPKGNLNVRTPSGASTTKK